MTKPVLIPESFTPKQADYCPFCGSPKTLPAALPINPNECKNCGNYFYVLEDEWYDCPYNYKLHEKELDKAIDESDKRYHLSRIERSLDWKYAKKNKYKKL